MTFEEICKALSASRRCSFERAVQEETEALIAYRRNTRPRRPVTAAIKASAREDAEKFYASDVTMYLTKDMLLTPDAVLNNRRYATAWAIACALKDEGTQKGTRCEVCLAPTDDGARRCPKHT